MLIDGADEYKETGPFVSQAWPIMRPNKSSDFAVLSFSVSTVITIILLVLAYRMNYGLFSLSRPEIDYVFNCKQKLCSAYPMRFIFRRSRYESDGYL